MSKFTTGFSKSRGVENRRDKRQTDPVLTVTIDGRIHQTVNWSLSGLRISGYSGAHKPGGRVTLNIQQKDPPGTKRILVNAKVIRVDRSKLEMAVKYDGLSQEAYEFFEHCFTEKLHGDDGKR
jgi:hypothetical protein